MSVRDVKNTVARLTRDGMFDANDVKEAMESAGSKVNAREMDVIENAILSADNVNIKRDSFDSSGYNTTQRAFDTARELGASFAILGGRLEAVESLEEAKSVREVSFGGTKIPKAVQELLAKAYDNGLEPFDVNDTERNNKTGEVKPVYTHYPSISAARGNMAFDYTEITPKALEDDKNAKDLEYNVIVPKSVLGPGGQRMTEITYEKRVGGTGNIAAHYDESGIHEDLYARGSSGQKWANNFAILSDGSIHALPAARRDGESGVILTNPALARGKRLLYMGHLDVRNGVIQGIEMSGRLSKLAAKGKQKFIDPVALFEAWGFEISPSIQRAAEAGGGVRFSNTSEGTPIRDLDKGIITNS